MARRGKGKVVEVSVPPTMLTPSYLASGDERNIALESADAEEEGDAGAPGRIQRAGPRKAVKPGSPANLSERVDVPDLMPSRKVQRRIAVGTGPPLADSEKVHYGSDPHPT